MYLLQLLGRELSQLPRLPPVRDNVLLQFLSRNLANSVATFIALHVLAPKLYWSLNERCTRILLGVIAFLFSQFIAALLELLSELSGEHAVFTQLLRG